jgi:hypothetical protein
LQKGLRSDGRLLNGIVRNDSGGMAPGYGHYWDGKGKNTTMLQFWHKYNQLKRWVFTVFSILFSLHSPFLMFLG